MPKSATAQISFDAIGTRWDIEVFDGLTVARTKKLQQQVLARIGEFDKNYSRFRPDSLVARMAGQAGDYTLPEDAGPLMDIYEKLYRISNGAVTPLIGSALSSAGYDATYSLRPSPDGVTAPPAWDDAMTYRPAASGKPAVLTLRQPALLDFGAAGKGYLADIIADLLRQEGCMRFCINAGGDFVYDDPENRAIQVALEHPHDPDMAVGVARLSGGSLCGSSGNRRAWGGYHHILDPKSLRSPEHIAALWVTAGSGLIADALATALFFVPAGVLSDEFDFDYAILNRDLSLMRSPGFPADFFVGPGNEKI